MEVTEIFYIHEIGSKKNQEDYLWPLPRLATPDDRIFIVCDGVGGAGHGEVASKIVAETVGAALQKASPDAIGLPMINGLLESARDKLLDYAVANIQAGEMATTFTLLYLAGERAFISWLGDSRVYHLRHNSVMYRTEDHSLVFSLIKSGEISEDEARSHPQRNVLLRAVRTDDTKPLAEGHWIEDIQDGDYFLLCTDGLLENITENDLFFILRQHEKGTLDIYKGFNLYCFDRTRDNYSMYLLRVSPGNPRERAKKAQNKVKSRTRLRIASLVALLVVLIAAAAFIIKVNFFSPHKEINVLVPVNKSRDSVEKAGR
jgi:PPM family protein phosphatase